MEKARISAPPELVAFAFVEEDYVASGGDVSVGLVRLFAPIFAENPNRVFDPREFAQEVERKFDIPMSPLVAEGLVEKLVQADYLYRESDDSHVYRIRPFRDTERAPKAELVDALLENYVQFARESLAVVGKEIDDAEVADSFFKEIVTLDFLSFLNRPDRDYFRGKTLTLGGHEKPDAKESEFTTEQVLQVICAQFVLTLMEENPERFSTLERIVSGVLIADVVLTLKAPSDLSEFEHVDVLIDGPLILDLLQLSSPEYQSYSEDLMRLIDQSGARKVTFSHVLDEMRGAIRAPLRAFSEGKEPFGPLGSRLRREIGLAAYSQAVLDDIETHVGRLGLAVIDAEEYQTEEFEKYCPENLTDSIRNSLGTLHMELERRERDTLSISTTLRMRAPKEHWPTLPDAGCVFVSRNDALAKRSSSSLRSNGRITLDDFPPAITDRQMAGLIWLVVGGDIGTISRKKLVANCSAVMSPRRDIVSKMRQMLTDMDPKKLEVFGALMRDQRAQRCLVHRTLGLPALITPESVDQILDDMRRSTAEEVARLKDEEIVKIKREHEEAFAATEDAHRDALSERDSRIEQLEGQTKELGSQLETQDSKYKDIHDTLAVLDKEKREDLDNRVRISVRKANRQEQLAKYIIVFLWVCLFGLVGFLANNLQILQALGLSESNATAAAVILTALLAGSGFWFVPHLLFESLLKRVWKRSFEKWTLELGVSGVLKDYTIDEFQKTVVQKVERR